MRTREPSRIIAGLTLLLLAEVVSAALLIPGPGTASSDDRRVPGLRGAGDDRGAGLVARRRKKRRKKKRPKKHALPPAPAPAPEAAPAAPASGGSFSRTNRIDFDAQLIRGQTTKAGEVQILERKDTEMKSMVKRRTSFRKEIIHTVFPEK